MTISTHNGPDYYTDVITPGDNNTIYFTDMEGNRVALGIMEIEGIYDMQMESSFKGSVLAKGPQN